MKQELNNENEENSFEYMHKLIDELETIIHKNMPKKALLPPLKGIAWEEGKIGTNKIKKAIEGLSVDEEKKYLVQVIVLGCLILGNDAAQHLAIAKALKSFKSFKPLIDTRRKQQLSGKLQEHPLKSQCMEIAKATWEEYPEVSLKNLATKLFLYLTDKYKDINISELTIQKTWLANADFRPSTRSKRNVKFELVI